MKNEPNIRLRLAKNLRRLRKERGWSQEDLSAEARLHRTQIGKIEKARQDTGVDIVEKLARTFGVQPGELLNFDSLPSPPEAVNDDS
jgi:transcriptional regulator with XRE-family HTH domain